ncbi:DUF1857-domain-containing protein [Roridomyces roridus]|uniref:DUF1857-domain-containing protein n=1 Tax=Roridomyces roridus TaxID=1738132 RepID=A0AAD7AYJ1_9AGAR|nr:DUF1857-domain-containing protein [Roridomyces roridus]
MAHSFAITRPVNPPGVEPVLTEEQVWKGLKFKAHSPDVFVPMISACKTISEDGNKIVHEITVGPVTLTETAELHPNSVVYFELSNGTRMTNVVSHGAGGEIFLTYCFANGLPGVPNDKPKPSSEVLNATIGKSLEKSIEIIRQMVVDGKL